MVEKLQALLGMPLPMQFDPVLVVITALFALFLVSFFAEILKMIILGR